MEKLIITGGQRLNGEIIVDGSKNAVLPILAACILVNGICVLENVPNLKDVRITIQILENLGCKIERDNLTLTIDTTGISKCRIDPELATQMRSSITFLGALISKFGEATISYPGD